MLFAFSITIFGYLTDCVHTVQYVLMHESPATSRRKNDTMNQFAIFLLATFC